MRVGGGIFLFICLVAGSVLGVRMREATAGILIGLAVGLAGAMLIGALDERRRKGKRG